MDHCSYVTLNDYLCEDRKFNAEDARWIFYYLCKGLEYLHSHNIVHRDIRSENILFQIKWNLSSIKIFDFGVFHLARIENGYLRATVGSVEYVAPEILKKMKYTSNVDMWSVGVLLFEMLYGYKPFTKKDENLESLYQQIMNGEYDKSRSKSIVLATADDLVGKLLEIDPSQRLTASDALRHPWLLPLDEVKLNDLITGYIRNEWQNNYLLTFAPNVIWSYYADLYWELHTELPKGYKFEYKTQYKMGFGTTSTVKACEMLSNGTKFAQKQLCDWMAYYARFYNELRILKELSDHPYIASLHSSYFSVRNDIYYMRLDLCEGGSLDDYLITNGLFSEQDARLILYQICKAVEYMHSKDVVKRNLNIYQILFTKKCDISEVKMIDFSVAKKCTNKTLSGWINSRIPYYVSPEIYQSKEYDTKSDMWSLGVLLYYMLSGYPPFSDTQKDEQSGKEILIFDFDKMVKGEYEMTTKHWNDEIVSKTAKDLIGKLLEVDPKKRLTAKMTLQHPWLLEQRQKIMICISGYIRIGSRNHTLQSFATDIIVKYYAFWM
eukprot:370495_1